MWQLLISAALFALISDAFSDDDLEKPLRGKSNHKGNKRKKIFISFAVVDIKYRDFLVAQSKNENSPFDFVDMSVKEPWTETIWKQKCRVKIRNCDGMIVLLSKNTWHSSGTRWEIKCARQERIPVVGMHIQKNDKGATPPELIGKKIITWSWDNLDNTIKKF